MNARTVQTIYRKEMTELLRDRRTLISMVVVPLAAISLLFTVMNFFIGETERKAETEAMSIAVAAPPSTPGLADALAAGGFTVKVRPDLRAAVDKKEAAAALEEATGATGEPEIRIIHDRTRPASDVSADKLRALLDDLKDARIRKSLAGSGMSEKILTPFSVTRVNIAGLKKMAGFALGGMIGYLVILLMFSGCMYPAIDMTAGEKERRTLEILLASPAGRDEIVLGKIMAATTASFTTAVLTVVSLLVSFRYGFTGSKMGAFIGAANVQLRDVLLVLVAVMPTAITAASIMIAIALFAKSFKEGQSYLTPVMMLVVFPAVLGMLPGAAQNPVLALLPVFNVSQLIKAIFLGESTAAGFLLTFGTNLAYAAIAFFVAVRIFQRESVLFRV